MNGQLDGIVVGGEFGVEFVHPSSSNIMATSVVTDKVGVFGQKALVGHEGMVVWLGTDWNVYQWDGRQVENRGFAEHLKAVPGVCPVLNLDRKNGDIYIGY